MYTQYHFEDFCQNQNMQGFPLLVVGQDVGLEHKMISLTTKCANYFVYTSWINLKNNSTKKRGKFSLSRICSTFSNAEEGYPDSLSTHVLVTPVLPCRIKCCYLLYCSMLKTFSKKLTKFSSVLLKVSSYDIHNGYIQGDFFAWLV